MENKCTARELPSVLALAYLGDARHTLYVRHRLVLRGISKSAELNRESLKYVTAGSQARLYETLEPLFTEEERDVFRRAFNSTHLNKPKHTSGKDYRTATGIEAVIGMLCFLGRDDRLGFLLDTAYKEDEKNDTEN
jgi:ribonuclease-3 family protein